MTLLRLSWTTRAVPRGNRCRWSSGSSLPSLANLLERSSPVLHLQLDVRRHRLSNPFALGVRRGTNYTPRKPDHQRIRRDLHSLRTHRTGSNDRAGTDAHTIQ